MRRSIVFVLGLVCAAGPAPAEIPDNVLKHLKAATVLVNAMGRYGESSGSGFVLAAKDKTVYIVTNAHTTMLRGKPAMAVSVVFRSGEKGEKSVDCTVAARDPELDLAVLKGRLDNPPKALALPEEIKVRETMDVHLVGYPFGRGLALGGGNPSVTIGKGTVSSLRRDAHGRLLALQIDGDVNPGNSGGPVVAADGTLLGICVAKIANTGIGLAIPVEHLRALLNGRVRGVAFDEGDPDGNRTPVEVTAHLLDPMNNIRRAELLIVHDKDAPEKWPPVKGLWKAMPDARTVSLKVDEAKATATVRFENDRLQRRGYWFQVRTVNRKGHTAFTEPRKMFVSQHLPVGAVTDDPLPDPGDDWLGAPATGDDDVDNETPTPSETDTILAGKKVNLDGALAVHLNLKIDDLMPDAVWIDGGKSFVLLERSGLLRRIASPALVQRQRLRLKAPCSAMHESAEGLVLTMPTRKELWVIDTNRFEVKRRIAVRNLTGVATAPGTSLAVAAAHSQLDIDRLALIDLKTGRQVKRYRTHDLRAQAGRSLRRHATPGKLKSIDALAMTSDGKHLLVLGGGSLHRMAVKDGGLEYEEVGPIIVDRGVARIDTSGDSNYVAAISPGGNLRPDDHPHMRKGGTYVYAVGNLQQPVISLDTGPGTRSLTFDKARRHLYTQSARRHILTFEPNGRVSREWSLPGVGRCRNLVLAPDGSAMLMLADEKVCWIRFEK